MKLLLFVFCLTLLQGCSEVEKKRNMNLKVQFENEKASLNEIVRNIKYDTTNNFKSGLIDLKSNFPKPLKGRVLLLKSDTTISAMFYLEKNDLNSTSLIYTNDPSQIEDLEEEINNQGNNLKLDKNWYLVIPEKNFLQQGL